MPRQKPTALPPYLLHKHSGHARTRIEGQEFWLGVHGTPESQERYDRLIAEWLANDRPLRIGTIPQV